MKKLRHYLCIVLCVAMLLCIMPVSYADDADFECSAISYTDASGKPVTSITPGTTLKAGMMVKPNSGASGSLVFAMMLYSGNKLIAADCETKTVSGGTDFSAQVTVPSDASDCKAVALLWNSVDGMRAVCASGVFPGGVNLIRSLTSDGKTIDGFDPDKKEYNITIANDAVIKPVIKAEAANNAAAIKYIGSKAFPGKTTVELTAADGSGTSAYTIKYISSKALADSARILKPDGGVYGNFDIGKDLRTGDGGDVKDPNRTYENGKLGSKVHWDRPQPGNISTGYTNEVRAISDEYKFLLGSDYLMSTAEGGNRANNGYQTWVKLYRSATLYVLSSEATSVDGWELKKGTKFMTVRNDTERYMNNCSIKHINVDDAKTGVDVAIPLETMYSINNKGAKVGGVSITAIVYDGYETIGGNETDTDPEPPSPTSEPPMPTSEPPMPTSGADSLKIAKTVDGVETLLSTAPKNISKNLTPYTDENPTGGSIIMFDRGRNAEYADYNNIKNIATGYEFITGCDFIGMPAQGYKPSHKPSAGYETSFKLYEGATIYVFTSVGNKEKAEEYGWTHAASADAGGFMTLRIKPNEDADALTPLKVLMTKHFDGNGETVVVNKEILYPTGGGETSAGFGLFVIKYDK